jgi:hypothetical protein
MISNCIASLLQTLDGTDVFKTTDMQTPHINSDPSNAILNDEITYQTPWINSTTFLDATKSEPQFDLSTILWLLDRISNNLFLWKCHEIVHKILLNAFRFHYIANISILIIAEVAEVAEDKSNPPKLNIQKQYSTINFYWEESYSVHRGELSTSWWHLPVKDLLISLNFFLRRSSNSRISFWN